MQVIEEILSNIGLTAPARDVYIDLVQNGESSARAISVRLLMSRPSVYDQIKILLKKGLVVEKYVEGKATFAVHDIRDLERLIDEKKDTLEKIQIKFKSQKDKFLKRTKSVDPKIRFVSGKDAILEVMHDMLWDEKVTLKTLWPYDEMIDLFGENDLSSFNEKRIRNNLKLKTIWCGDFKLGIKKGGRNIWWDGDRGVDRRYAPTGFSPQMAYTIYGDKVFFISSSSESFGFSVHSLDFANMMSAQFDLLWSLSKKS
jgi:predicted transcriptional regulator